MHTRRHLFHGNRPRAFQGRASRIYNFVAGTVLRRLYWRLAQDVAEAAPRDAAVLDVGTGPGFLLVELARLRPDLHVTGVDLSADMIAAAGRNLSQYGARAAAKVGDVTDLPFADRSFDLIVSSLSLHHWDDPEAAVPELARVLRPRGRLHIYDFRFAPFGELAAAARARSLFTANAPQVSSIRTGLLFFPRCVRWVMSS
jgi:ubiquinone/menaquinone biosynthesis C-methylase UbiE